MSNPILVVGAGPVGMTMAAELARYGVPVRIIDKSAARTDKSKALTIWSRTLELLARAGIADKFVSAGLKLRGANLVAGAEHIARIEFEGVASDYPFGLSLPQSETERLLEDHLRTLGVTVERKVELTAFKDTSTGVACTLHHADGSEETVDASWLIGCDGAHSLVRRTLGLEFAGETVPTDFVLADLHVAGMTLPGDEVGIFWNPHGMALFVPIAPGRYRVIADLGPSKGGPRTDPPLADVQAIVDTRGPGGITLSDPTWIAAFGVNERKVAEYRVGRVFVAGDAAHIHSPAGGQGMNTGMQDAFNLAWKLALVSEGIASAAATLDSYSLERSPVAKMVLEESGRLLNISTIKNPVVQQVRNFVAHHVLGLPVARRFMADHLSEVSIAYPDSPLNGGSARGLKGPVAGQRIVDGASFGAGNTPRFALMAADGEGARELISAFPALLEGKVRHPPDEAGIWLVRPDGYVALAEQNEDWSAVSHYLQQIAR